MYNNPAFSISKASTLHQENIGKVEIFQHDGKKWNRYEQDAKILVEQDIRSPAIIFASSMTFMSNKELMTRLCSQYDIPDVFWTKASLKASGYFGCCDFLDDEGYVMGYNTWLRFLVKMTKAGGDTGVLYHWEKIKVFTKFEVTKTDVMLCFDMPQHFKWALKNAVVRNYSNFEMRDPFSMPAILVNEVISLFDTSVWSLRDLVRSVERKRAYTERPQPDYYQFHEISRHVIHSTETLSLAVKTIESMLEQHKLYLQDSPSLTGKAREPGRRIQHSLLHSKSLSQCLKGRSEALSLRLQNEINLAFNTVSQYDSQTAVKIGHAAQADSASMRSISVLTFLFFPGTFISSILGMDFFNFTPSEDGAPQRWSVSNKLWIFFALTIPLTLVTGIAWLFWERRSDQKRAAHGISVNTMPSLEKVM